MACAGTMGRQASEGGEPMSGLRLRALGFCGADDSCSPELLSAVSERYLWIEWGVLFREDKQGTPRYASLDWVERLAAVNYRRRMRLAGHLCSQYVTQILEGDGSFVADMHRRVGFDRFQINATAANNVDTSSLGPETAERLRGVMLSLPSVEFIVQRNEETAELWRHLERDPPPNLSFLFDESKGLGVAAAFWPPPPTTGVKFGYAGGLGPKNLEAQITKMAVAAPGETIWVDMESSLRTALEDGADIFDLNKCMSCVLQVLALGLQEVRPASCRL